MNLHRLLLALPVMACAGQSLPEPEPIPGLQPPKGAARERWFLANADSLLSLDPGAEAKAAAARGDCHLYGVVGYALVVPGIPRNRAETYKIYFFPTSDDYTREKYPAARRSYEDAAHRYAEAYNLVAIEATQCQR
jgi:hypothetical protein